MQKFSRDWSSDMARKNRAAAYYNKKIQLDKLIKGITYNVERGFSGIKVDARGLDYSCILWAKQNGYAFKRIGNEILIAWEPEGLVQYVIYDPYRGEYVRDHRQQPTDFSLPKRYYLETRY